MAHLMLVVLALAAVLAAFQPTDSRWRLLWASLAISILCAAAQI